MNIKVSDLRKFQKLSSHIETSGVSPASDSIKFGDGVIIKNAHSAFVSFDCVDSTESVLVPEHILSSLLKETSSSFINITVKEKQVVVSDGRDKIPFGLINLKEFSNPPKPDSERKFITLEFLSAIGKCAETCAPYKDELNLYMFVHVGDNMAASGDGFMGVSFPIEEDIQMVLRAKTASFVSKMSVAETSESKGHYFFYGTDFVMGFSKHEIGYFAMGKKISDAPKERTFSMSANDLLSFNNLNISLFKGQSTFVTISNGKLDASDTMGSSQPSRDYEGVKIAEPFTFNAESMNRVIKAMGVEELDFYNSERAYFIKSTGTKATAIIAKISK